MSAAPSEVDTNGGKGAKRRRFFSNSKEDQAIARSEQKHLASTFESDFKWIKGALLENPHLMITVKAVLEAKLRKQGERLYRGDRNLGNVAKKHCIRAVAAMSELSLDVFNNLPDAGILCRSLLHVGLGHGPSYRLPEKEMLVGEFDAWVAKLHRFNNLPLRGIEITDHCISGVHFGVFVFSPPAHGSEICTQATLQGRPVTLPESMQLRWAEIGKGILVIDNYSVEAAGMILKDEGTTLNCMKKFGKHLSFAATPDSEKDSKPDSVKSGQSKPDSAKSGKNKPDSAKSTASSMAKQVEGDHARQEDDSDDDAGVESDDTMKENNLARKEEDRKTKKQDSGDDAAEVEYDSAAKENDSAAKEDDPAMKQPAPPARRPAKTAVPAPPPDGSV